MKFTFALRTKAHQLYHLSYASRNLTCSPSPRLMPTMIRRWTRFARPMPSLLPHTHYVVKFYTSPHADVLIFSFPFYFPLCKISFMTIAFVIIGRRMPTLVISTVITLSPSCIRRRCTIRCMSSYCTVSRPCIIWSSWIDYVLATALYSYITSPNPCWVFATANLQTYLPCYSP